MSDEQQTGARDAHGRFLAGHGSANPGGKTRASRIVRERIAARLDDVLDSLFLLVNLGDTQALRLALERVCPPIKSDAEPTEIDGLAEAKTLPEKAEVVLSAVGAGSLDADRAAKVLQAIASAAALTELEELKQRLAALESRDLIG
ncbi:MAG: hypothetical protein WD795_16510 [Woeseia sp.]